MSRSGRAGTPIAPAARSAAMAFRERLGSSRQISRPSADQTPVRVVLRKTDHPMILVVDDDMDAREMYSQYLKSKGCDVFQAADGADAVRKAADLWPNVIVMDLAMPKMDGWEAIRRLHQSSWTSTIPVIAVSGFAEGRDAAFASGCD